MTTPRGTIFLVGGINDILIVTRSWDYGFRWSGLPHRRVRFLWQQGFVATLTFKDLWNTPHHKAEARRLIGLIHEAQTQHPGEPVHVVAHSAGTAITTYALEQLGATNAITSAIFVSSALSPKYDLQAALQGTKRGILNVQSVLDFFYLGIGTSLLGTADRSWRPAAGMVGFQQHHEQLKTYRWRLRDVAIGWLGGHLSIASPWFVKRVLAPWIQQAESGEQTDS